MDKPKRQNGRDILEILNTEWSTAPTAEIALDNSDFTPISQKKNWAYSDDTYWAVGTTCKTLPSSLFEPGYSEGQGFTLKEMVNNLDDIIDLPDSESEKVLAEIKEFTSKKEVFNKLGFLYKRGILLFGPPGSGKTITVQQLIKMFTREMDGIAVLCGHPKLLTGALEDFRKLEPDRQILVIMEDLEALIVRFCESDFLSLLDGESQLQNVVYVATTNYPENLDIRFKDRPSRFDTVRRIGMPSRAARKTYIQAKLPDLGESTLQEYLDNTEDYSIAYIKELIILIQCFGYSLEDATARLNKMRNSTPNSNDKDGGVGFGFAGK